MQSWIYRELQFTALDLVLLLFVTRYVLMFIWCWFNVCYVKWVVWLRCICKFTIRLRPLFQEEQQQEQQQEEEQEKEEQDQKKNMQHVKSRLCQNISHRIHVYMYGICTYIWLIFMLNGGKSTSPMDPKGFVSFLFRFLFGNMFQM